MRDQNQVDVSVITPFYRGNAFLETLFHCICANAHTASELNIELIVINDSPDCPVQYKEDWVDGFNLRIHCNPVNVGIHQSRINGLQMARGTFVVFLDQDDLIADNALRSQWQYAMSADVIVANGRNENRNMTVPIYQSVAHQKQVMYSRFYFSVGCMIVSPGQCLLRREIIPKLWIENSISHNGADDYFLWLLLLNRECRWKINPEELYTHVDTGENVSIDLEKMIRSSIEVLDVLRFEGILTEQQVSQAKRRFEMRRMYEGREKWRKAMACLRYPNLFWELVQYTYLKKFCK